MKSNNETLLGISKAAQLLGVHPLTLRNWAEKGYVPYYRTPGGHRRFKVSDLTSFLQKVNAGSEEDVLIATARNAVRQALATLPRHPPVPSIPSSTRLMTNDKQRSAMRSVGQKLLGLTIQYVGGGADETILRKAKDIGKMYGTYMLHNGMSFSETVATFNFFRDTIIEATFDAQANAVDIDTANPQLYRRLNHFFNEVLLATVEYAEKAMSKFALGGNDLLNE